MDNEPDNMVNIIGFNGRQGLSIERPCGRGGETLTLFVGVLLGGLLFSLTVPSVIYFLSLI